MSINLVSINHVKPEPHEVIEGGIAWEFVCGRDDDGALAEWHSDMRAPHYIWREHEVDYDIIGFHQYRKHLWFRSGLDPRRWHDLDLPTFEAYKRWLTEWDGRTIQSMLAQVDIIVAPPYWCTNGENMTTDYQRSRSPKDWAAFMEVVHGFLPKANFQLPYISAMQFVTRASVFDRYMTVWNGVMAALEPLITAEDTHDPVYKKRAIAYLDERLFAVWLEQSGLDQAMVPLVNCWDAK